MCSFVLCECARACTQSIGAFRTPCCRLEREGHDDLAQLPLYPKYRTLPKSEQTHTKWIINYLHTCKHVRLSEGVMV